MVVCVVSDLHCGSTVGLSPPSVLMDDGGEYRASKEQLEIWEKWEVFQDKVKKLAGKRPIISVVNGDLVEGNHHHSTQIQSENPSVQIDIAEQSLNRLARMSKKLFVVRGTETHSGQSASWEESIARKIGATGNPVGLSSWWILPLDVGGVMMDFAHHGRVGGLPWTRPNGSVSLAAQTIIHYVERGKWPPKLVFRSHFHQYVDTYKAFKSIRLIGTPCWQNPTAYVYKRSPGVQSDIGGVIIECDGGEYRIHAKYSKSPIVDTYEVKV